MYSFLYILHQTFSGQKLPPSDQRAKIAPFQPESFFRKKSSNFALKTGQMGPEKLDLAKGDLNQQFLGLELVSRCVIAILKFCLQGGQK